MHQTAISNDPCDFIYRFRHTLDTLLSTHGHSIQNNVVYVIKCYFKFDEKTPRPSFLMCGGILGEQVVSVCSFFWISRQMKACYDIDSFQRKNIKTYCVFILNIKAYTVHFWIDLA